jgi:hypothetical protein
VAAYLTARPGARVCYGCITKALGITHDETRHAGAVLKSTAGFQIKPMTCSACAQRRVTMSITKAVEVKPPPAGEASSPSGRLAGFLRARPGYGFCGHCLVRELGGVPLRELRVAMWELEHDAGFAIRTSQCVRCLVTTRVIRYDEPVEEMGARRVIDFLAQSAGADFCASCIGLSCGLPLAAVRDIVGVLAPIPELMRRDGACGLCGRRQSVVCLRPGHVDAAGRRAVLLDGSPGGSSRHCGHRIDQRSP